MSRLPHVPWLRRWGGHLVSLLAVAAVVWWGARQEPPQLPTGATALTYLAVAVGLYGVATLVRGWRWEQLLRRMDAGHRKADAYALVPVGYMGNTVLPARGGELLRVVLLGRRSRAGTPELVGSIITERVLDAASLALFFAAVTWAGIAGSPLGQGPAFVAVGLVALAGALAWGFRRLRQRGRLEGLAARIRPLASASRPLLRRYGLVLLLTTLVVWLIEGGIFWLVARSLSLDVSLPDGVFLVVLSAAAALIPAAPGYLGTFDAALLFGLGAIGVAGGQAVGYVLLVRFVLFLPITLVGLGLFLARYGGLRVRRARAAAVRASPAGREAG